MNPLPPLLSLLLLLPATLSSPFPLPTSPPLSLLARNHAGPPANYSTEVTNPTAVVAAASTSSLISTSSFNSTDPNNNLGQTLFGGIPSQLLEWVAIVIVSGVLLSMLIARYLFIRRYYPPSFRSYFIPSKGVHIKFLHISIQGPPPRPSRTIFSPSGVRLGGRVRGRRDRTTTGPGIEEGGRRVGAPEEDDHGEDPITTSDLPRYAIDSDLPSYDFVDGPSAASRICVDPSAPLPSSTPVEGDIPTVQEYEEATRRAAAAVIPIQRPVRARIEGETRRNSEGSSVRTVVGEEEEVKEEEGGIEMKEIGGGKEEDGGESPQGRDR